jgi:acetyl-CoA C-acetyltransferase
MRSEPTTAAERDQVNPQAGREAAASLWRQAGITDPVTEIDGRLPVNMSGGVLSPHPIGASGMLRFAEAALQVRGEAGEHQVDGARRALGHAYGGGSQFFAMWVVGADRP